MNSAENMRFLEALQRFTERLEWFTTGRDPEAGLETEELRLVLAEWDETLEPWRTKLTDTDFKQRLDDLAPWVAKGRAKVRLMFLAALHQAAEAKLKWRLWEIILRTPGHIKKTLEVVNPAQREILLETARNKLGGELDTAGMFQEAMTHADAWEEDWLKALAAIKKTWADECGPEIERRMGSDDLPAIIAWVKEIRAEIAAIQQEHPEFRP